MKKILIVLFVSLMFQMPLYAKAYVIVNSDGSIHTVAEKADDVLMNGQRRYEIEAWPEGAIDNQMLYWDGLKLVEKPEAEQQAIILDRLETRRKSKMRSAMKELKMLEELEELDNKADYSKEKKKYQDIIDQNKKI